MQTKLGKGDKVIGRFSGETLCLLGSGDDASEFTGGEGVYCGLDVDTVLTVSTNNPVSWLAGTLVSFLVLSRLELNSGV